MNKVSILRLSGLRGGQNFWFTSVTQGSSVTEFRLCPLKMILSIYCSFGFVTFFFAHAWVLKISVPRLRYFLNRMGVVQDTLRSEYFISIYDIVLYTVCENVRTHVDIFKPSRLFSGLWPTYRSAVIFFYAYAHRS